ncbi:uncharacterized protein VP01_334g3 [Puccinia sorghi]|uniref:EGF-like domain-containing protein n=1 Tax=Puccinia sorghi TaxID=27349 RepID=A0A0L6UXW7_9BASI|nr:uncharacterized protein VP01_334g3 [Puccinia sorghi]
MLGGVPIGKAIQIVTFAFLGELLKMRGVHGSLINSLCSPEVCINGTASQLFTGVVLDDSPVGTLLTPGSYSRFHDVSSRALANPGFSVDQQAGLVVAQLSPMIAYPRPVYQDQPQLIGEDFSKPNTPVASFLLAEGYHAAFGIGGTVKVLAHDSCPNMKQWSLKGLELMSVESSNCPGGCGSGGSCSSSTSACQCKTGYSGPRCDSCAKGFFGPDCQPCPNCEKSSGTCDDGTTGTGSCLPLDLSRTQKNLLSISQSNCNCLNGVCTGATSCLCSAGWTTSSNGTLCASCKDGFFLDAQGECAGELQILSIVLSPNDSTTCLPSPINLIGGAPTSCNDGFFNSHNSTCATCDPTCSSCFGPSASSCTRCISPKALLSTGHTDNNTLDASCVDVDLNTGVCSSPPGSLLFLMNQSKGICEPAPHLCSAATIPGFSLLHPESTSSAGAVCSACATGALLLPAKPDGAVGKCVGVCPQGTYNDLRGHCSQCPAGCLTCNITEDGAHPQCQTCANPSAFLFEGTCVDVCPSGTFAGVTANETPKIPKGVNSCLPCSASCGDCTQSPTTCRTCPKNRPALDPATQTCALACPKGKFADPNSGGRCSLCEATCASCSGAGSGDCLSCKAGDVLRVGKCLPSTCASNSTHIVNGWGICLEDLLAASSHQNSRGVPPWLIVLVAMLLSATLGCLCLLIWRLWQQKKRQQKTRRFGNGLASADIKLHQLDERKISENHRSSWSIHDSYYRRDERASSVIDPSLLSRTPTTPSEFKIKRKVVPTDGMDDWERETISMYSNSELPARGNHFSSPPEPRPNNPGFIEPQNVATIASNQSAPRGPLASKATREGC